MVLSATARPVANAFSLECRRRVRSHMVATNNNRAIPHIASEPSQMQGCEKRNRGDSGLPPGLTILLRTWVEPTVTLR